MSFLGADTDELRGAADECMQGKEITDQVITYLQALIALLKAASFFSGGASAAYAEYLETVVVPWLQKISQALELFAKVLGGNADAQDQASAGETVNASAIPTYTSQVGTGDNSVQPFTGSVLGSGNAGAAFGAITGAASTMGDSPATGGTQVTVTSPDGTVTTVNAGGGATTTAPGTTTPVTTTPISTPVTDSVTGQRSALDGGRWHVADPSSGGAGAGSGGGGGGSVGSGGGGGSYGGGSGSVDSGALGTSDAARTDTHGATPVHSTGGTGGGTPGAEALTQNAGYTGDPVTTGGDSNGTSYGAAAGVAGAAGALGLGGAALAARGGGSGTVTGGADGEIDRIGAANGFGSKGDDVSAMQQRLTDAGYNTQGVDGQWGPNTQAAYDQYRADHPLPVQNGTGFSSPSGYDYNQIRGVRNNPNVTPEFLRALEGVAQRTGAQPEHLMGVMSLETMGTFRPNIQNPDTHATGLIQFIPRTAEGLGTSTAELSRMTPTEQLNVVERYLSQPAYRGRVGTLEGLYSAVLPGRIMESDDVIFRPGTEAYRDNRWLDTDGTPGITLREAVDQVRARMGTGAGAR